MQTIVRAPPKIRAIPLTPDQQRSLRFSAIRRILASSNAPDQATRTALLARLATSAPPGDKLADELLQHMLDNYHAGNGHQIAVTWLFSLYKELLMKQHAPGSNTDGTTVAGDVISDGALSGVQDDKPLKTEGSPAQQSPLSSAEPMQVDSKGALPASAHAVNSNRQKVEKQVGRVLHLASLYSA